jgi:hypothetical protein
MDYSSYPQFAQTINRSFSINWPQGLAGILVGCSEKGFVLAQSFIDHICTGRNWTVGRELVDKFPFLKDAVNVKQTGYH